MFAMPAQTITAPVLGRASCSTRVPIRYAARVATPRSANPNASPAPTPAVISTCVTVKNVTTGIRT